MPYDVGGNGDCFLSLFLINCTKLQTCTLKLEKLELNPKRIIQNILLKVFQIITGETKFSKCHQQAHGVTISESK